MRRRGPAAFAAVAAIGLVAGTAAPARAASRWELEAIHVPQANAISTGAGVTVAVLDTGVDTDHPMVKGSVTTGPDFVKSGAKRGDEYWGDHGTAMASQVLEAAPDAHILSVRVIMDERDPQWVRGGKRPFADDPVHNGIRYAVDHGADVISMSFGDVIAELGGYDTRLEADVRYAVAHGVTLVAAAGNGGDLAMPGATNNDSYPAAYPGVIGVGAADRGGGRAVFSQVHAYVTVLAPGVRVYAAKHYGTYQVIDGTSSAAALTAGAAALIRAKYPRLSPWQVRQALVSSASHHGHWNPLTGWGLIDARGALRAAAKLTPQPAVAQPVPYEGRRYFGPGPARVHAKANPGFLWIGVGAMALGLWAIGGAVALAVRGRRRAGPGREPTAPYWDTL